jgi:hypothetical protein
MPAVPPNGDVDPAQEPAMPDHAYPGPAHREQKPETISTDPALAEVDAKKIMKVPDRLLVIFYSAALVNALVGQTQGASLWLHWDIVPALAAVGTAELAGVAIMAYADARRRLNEAAVGARVLSFLVAAGAVALNWFGHYDSKDQPTIAGAYFAGMTGLAYLIYVIRTEAKRRDRLRKLGRLAHTPPAYGMWQWAFHPNLTRRARNLARDDAQLTREKSLAAAKAEIREEKRHAAVVAVLARYAQATARDAQAGEAVVHAYNLDDIAKRITAGADADALAQMVLALGTPDVTRAIAAAEQARPPIRIGPVKVGRRGRTARPDGVDGDRPPVVDGVVDDPAGRPDGVTVRNNLPPGRVVRTGNGRADGGRPDGVDGTADGSSGRGPDGRTGTRPDGVDGVADGSSGPAADGRTGARPGGADGSSGRHRPGTDLQVIDGGRAPANTRPSGGRVAPDEHAGWVDDIWQTFADEIHGRFGQGNESALTQGMVGRRIGKTGRPVRRVLDALEARYAQYQAGQVDGPGRVGTRPADDHVADGPSERAADGGR